MPQINYKNLITKKARLLGKEVDEFPSLRGYNRKVIKAEGDKVTYRFHTRQIHYKDSLTGNFEDIDTRLFFDNEKKVFRQNKASYHCEIPEFADQTFDFHNLYEGADHHLFARPVANHVKGQVFNDQEDGHYVLYTDAFGSGIDLKVYAYHHGLKKVIIIRNESLKNQTLTFDFEIVNADELDFVDQTDRRSWDKRNNLNFKSKTITLGKNNKHTFFRDALVWDDANKIESIDIDLITERNKIFIRKTVSPKFMTSAVFPVMTDHPTTYFSGSGDGVVYFATSGWDAVHDSLGGFPSSTNMSFLVGVGLGQVSSGNDNISRSFFPIDTSGIGDTDTITLATLNIYMFSTGSKNDDNDGNDFFSVVQTTQASTSTLASGDYDNCGDINNPIEGIDTADRIDISSIASDAYKLFPLNSTGITWINKSGFSKFGMREGHDILDDAPNFAFDDRGNGAIVAFSEETSGTKDPYIDVTVSVASEDLEPDVNDDISILESVTISLPNSLAISVNDLVDLDETATIENLELYSDVFDVVNLVESVISELNLLFSVNDLIIIAESIIIENKELYLNINDSINIEENVTTRSDENLNINDQISIEESVTVANENLYGAVFDAITIEEAVSIETDFNININDEISVEDAPTVEVITFVGDDLNINVNDSITIAESVTIENKELSLSVNDSITITESVQTFTDENINANDSITVTEDVSVENKETYSDVFDAITLEESVLIETDLNINLSDSITVEDAPETEVITFAGDDLEIPVSDSITVEETSTVENTNLGNISVTDDITLTELITMLETGFISVSESITLSEVITRYLENYINVNDSITLQESVTRHLDVNISVNDSINIAENITVENKELAVSVSESITLDDSGTPLVSEEGIYNVPVSENIGVTESVTIEADLAGVNCNDATAITESVTCRTELNINSSDSITITESSTLAPELVISESEEISLTEVNAFETISFININDVVAVSESASSNLESFIQVNDIIVTEDNVIIVNTDLGSIFVTEDITAEEYFNVSPTNLFTEINVSDSIVISENVLLDSLIIYVRLMSKLADDMNLVSKTTDEIKLKSAIYKDIEK